MALVPPNMRGIDASQEIPGDARSDILGTRIPPLPPVAMKALDILADPDFNLRMLAGVLGEDTVLAARILAIGRAPYHRQRTVPASLQAALQVIGLRDLRNVIFTSALRNVSAATPESLWAHLVGAALYPILGWAAVAAAPVLASELTPLQLGLMVGGGLAYTIGFPVLMLHRPDPWPRRFGYHEVWHTFTVVAAALHFAAVASIVA